MAVSTLFAVGKFRKNAIKNNWRIKIFLFGVPPPACWGICLRNCRLMVCIKQWMGGVTNKPVGADQILCIYRDATTDASYDMYPVDDPMVDDRADGFCRPLELDLVMLGDSKMGHLPACLAGQIFITNDCCGQCQIEEVSQFGIDRVLGCQLLEVFGETSRKPAAQFL